MVDLNAGTVKHPQSEQDGQTQTSSTHGTRHGAGLVFCGFSVTGLFIRMTKIYDQKLLEVSLHGKLRTVSTTELFQLIADGYTPALTEQGCEDLKRLMWLATQIFVQGDWFLQPRSTSPASPIVKAGKPKAKR